MWWLSGECDDQSRVHPCRQEDASAGHRGQTGTSSFVLFFIREFFFGFFSRQVLDSFWLHQNAKGVVDTSS